MICNGDLEWIIYFNLSLYGYCNIKKISHYQIGIRKILQHHIAVWSNF
jgi:hypothetical protein